MNMLNQIVLMGCLTRDPELRRTQSGTSVANFAIAVDRDFVSDGNRETDFVDCVAWGKTAEFISSYFSKGRAIAVTGRLQIRSWKTDEGATRRAAEVVVDRGYFADSKREDKPTQTFSRLPDDTEVPFSMNETLDESMKSVADTYFGFSEDSPF